MSAAPPRNGEGNAYTAPPSSRINGGDGPAIPVPSAAPFSAPVMEGSNLAVSTRRCVRWSEDLICPSPILRSERRKGWFNRRGDQLWTNDGRYKSPEDYPEFNDGWMNEEGVRIDMEHRLIPKPPLRSALKRPKNAQANQ
ncbi:hypothetical protein B0H21DRAFT_748879 [Amylocystis lapponica]|nr:hypothetical protein B0H21DRAFT_748879 [Amylocystis lapponica]